jgi:hypothetical protein
MEATTAARRLNIVVDPQLISVPKLGTRQIDLQMEKSNVRF